MSKQKFSAELREAIWNAHNKKCAYTGCLLDVSNFHIDHIIPERLAANPDEFRELATSLGLDDNFKISGSENLLPCHPGANLRKGGDVLDSPQTHYFLDLASRHKKKIVKNLSHKKELYDRGKALILLQQGVESGEITFEDVAEIFNESERNSDDIFQLIERLHFVDHSEIQSIARSDIKELRDRPIRLGKNSHLEGVSLTDPNDEKAKILVQTCREYDEAIKAGYYAFTTYDIKTSVFFEHQCGLLNSLRTASTPEQSFISNPRVGIVDLNFIPYDLFPDLADEGENRVPDQSYQDKVDDGTMIVKRTSQNTLVVEEEGMGQQLVEVARADFTGDGFEDILLFEYCYAIGGTLGFGGNRILARTTADGLFETVR